MVACFWEALCGNLEGQSCEPASIVVTPAISSERFEDRLGQYSEVPSAHSSLSTEGAGEQGRPHRNQYLRMFANDRQCHHPVTAYGRTDRTVRFGILWLGNTYGTHVQVPSGHDGSPPSISSSQSKRLQAEVVHCKCCQEYVEEDESAFCLKLSYTACREGPFQESIHLNWGDGGHLVVQVRGSVMGRSSGRPSLRPGVYFVTQALEEAVTEAGSSVERFTDDVHEL